MFGNTNIIQYRVLDYHSVQHISSTQGPLLFSPQDPSVQHVQCVNPTPKNHQFTTKKRPFNKPVSSTHKKRQFSIKKRPFNTPVSSKPKNRQFSNNNPSVQHTSQFNIRYFIYLSIQHTPKFNTKKQT